MPNYSYKKNDKTTYSILCQYGNLELAIRYAARLESLYNDSNYATHKPCTKVHHIVQELLNPEEILNIFA